MIAALLRLARSGLRVAWMYIVAADAVALDILKRYQKQGRLMLRLGKKGPKIVVKKKPEQAA